MPVSVCGSMQSATPDREAGKERQRDSNQLRDSETSWTGSEKQGRGKREKDEHTKIYTVLK